MASSKTLLLLILLLLTVSMTLTAKPAAASVSKPEFTLQYVDRSYDVPVTYTYSTEPYTGQQIAHSSGGYHVDNRTIEITIRNQPFTPYLDADNHTVELFYNVRSKGHFEDWASSSGGGGATGLHSSTSGYTVISINIQNWNGVRDGGQIDFQVEAITGYPASDANYCGSIHFTTIEESGWSNTQTITVGNSSTATPTQPAYTSWPTPTASPNPTATASPDQNPTATPIQPDTQTGVLFGFDWEQTALIVAAVAIAGFVVALVVLWRKTASK
jgi:hypothetical protein